MGQFVRANSRPGRRGLFEGGEMTNEDWAAAEAYGASLPDPSWSPGGGAGSTTEWGPNMGGGPYPQPARRTVFPDAGGGNNQTINPLGGIGRFIGRGIRALGHKLQGLRGWNPDGTPKTQAQWEEEREQRIAQKRINNILGRDAPATKATNINLNRLYNTLGTPEAGRNLFTEGEINIRISPAMRQIYQTPDYKLMEGQGTTDFNRLSKNEGITKGTLNRKWIGTKPESGLTMMEEFYNKPITQRWADQTGMDLQEAGYIPKNLGVGFYGSDSIARGLHKKATTEGVGATEFGKYIEGAELGAHTDYANKLLNELKLSDKVKSLGDDYVRGFDIKGLGDSYDDQRKAVGTLLEREETKKEALKGTDKSWMLGPGDKRPAVREFISDYSQNKDRLNDLGITTLEEYKDFINKSIGIAQGGRVGYNTGGRVGILAAF